MSNWRECPVQISGGFWLLIAWFALAAGWRMLGTVLSAAAVHELGHWAVLRLLGAEIRSLRIGVLGAVMETDSAGLSYGGELAAVLAGPAANICCALALAACGQAEGYVLAGAHLALGCFNLLPVRPLDGGRALWLALTWLLGPAAGERAAGIVGTCGSLALALALIAAMGMSGGSLWLLPAFFGLLSCAIREMRAFLP